MKVWEAQPIDERRMNMKMITTMLLALYLMIMAGNAAAEDVCRAMENNTGLILIIKACEMDRAVSGDAAVSKSKYCRFVANHSKIIMDANRQAHNYSMSKNLEPAVACVNKFNAANESDAVIVARVMNRF